MLTKNSNSIFPIGICPRLGIGTKPIGHSTIRHNWIQLDSVELFPQLILDLIRLDWTFFPKRQNWFQLDICWEIKFPIGDISTGEIYNWKKQNPTNSDSLKSNQLSPTEFPIGLSWSKILFQLEIQYSNINQLTPSQYQLNPIHSKWISNWNELAISVRDMVFSIYVYVSNYFLYFRLSGQFTNNNKLT